MTVVVIGQLNGGAGPPVLPHADRSRLRASAPAIVSELHMVRVLSRKALCGDGLSPEIRRAVGEACLLHVWSLKEFFYGDAGTSRAIVASDYFRSEREWEERRPPLDAVLALEASRLHGYLIPGGREEVEAGSGEWRCPFHRLAREISRVAEAFLEALPEDRARWFQASLARGALT